MKKIFYFVAITSWFTFYLPLAHAKNCGIFAGKQIITYGRLSCVEAKKIFRSFNKGHIPRGWTCGQSVGGCGKGKKGFYFKSQRLSKKKIINESRKQ